MTNENTRNTKSLQTLGAQVSCGPCQSILMYMQMRRSLSVTPYHQVVSTLYNGGHVSQERPRCVQSHCSCMGWSNPFIVAQIKSWKRQRMSLGWFARLTSITDTNTSH